jgi:hypothetical protein
MQGYLTQRKRRPVGPYRRDHAQGPSGVLGGWALSYGRGTSVATTEHSPLAFHHPISGWPEVRICVKSLISTSTRGVSPESDSFVRFLYYDLVWTSALPSHPPLPSSPRLKTPPIPGQRWVLAGQCNHGEGKKVMQGYLAHKKPPLP